MEIKSIKNHAEYTYLKKLVELFDETYVWESNEIATSMIRMAVNAIIRMVNEGYNCWEIKDALFSLERHLKEFKTLKDTMAINPVYKHFGIYKKGPFNEEKNSFERFNNFISKDNHELDKSNIA